MTAPREPGDAQGRDALRRDELVLHYQPAVDLRTGEVVSVEALIRWNHPERGLLPPGEFVPIAEATGLAADITKWVLTHACRQTRDWQSAGLASLRVAVNSCSRELTGGLLGLITDTLRAADLDPECLEIEVTERFLGEDDAVRDDMLVELKRLGVYITLDDFGTGYSSLARLRDFPVDVIKIDRLFITELDKTAAIAKSIIALAGNLGVAVVAEGVEHEHQRAWLRDAGWQRRVRVSHLRTAACGGDHRLAARARELTQADLVSGRAAHDVLAALTYRRRRTTDPQRPSPIRSSVAVARTSAA